ncbi:uncharacterized protein LOC124887241 [Capsicum annuum]|uniref:uncharacterized protein LOC124887241 n=1 Tax=Capsicum annuum TaxID=4072 RepID=UPI001FB12FE7|nr:uncharacterized protein LOC124887241 [Capsicum annuum]
MFDRKTTQHFELPYPLWKEESRHIHRMLTASNSLKRSEYLHTDIGSNFFCSPNTEAINNIQTVNILSIYLNVSCKKRAVRCTKAPAMRRVRRRAPPQGCIVRSLALHFCQRLFPRLELVTSWSHDSNCTSYSKALLLYKHIL